MMMIIIIIIIIIKIIVIIIDRTVIRGVKFRKKNLAMGSINYKKAYDMVPHSWINECLDLFEVAESI